jgi:hypothetical protein
MVRAGMVKMMIGRVKGCVGALRERGKILLIGMSKIAVLGVSVLSVTSMVFPLPDSIVFQ